MEVRRSPCAYGEKDFGQPRRPTSPMRAKCDSDALQNPVEWMAYDGTHANHARSQRHYGMCFRLQRLRGQNRTLLSVLKSLERPLGPAAETPWH